MSRRRIEKGEERLSGLLSLPGLPSLPCSRIVKAEYRITLCFIFFVLCYLLFASSLQAKMTGACSDCHTMHNSQNGQPMIYLAPGETDTTPKGALLRGTCLGCHGRGPTNIVNGTPQVLHTGTDLAAGNFAYITGAKPRISGDSNTVGHNVIDLGTNETILTSPPGDQNNTNITNNNFTCSGTKGCHGNRAEGDKLLSLKGAHHTDDTVLKFGSGLNEDNQGGTVGLSYRFLKGVKGGEDSDWQATISPTKHNEYKGASSMGSSSLTDPAGNTMSGLCAECHGYFYGTTSSEAGNASPWLRHPTDIILPGATTEYQYYNGGTGSNNPYNLDVPVARVNIPDSPSGFVNPGTGEAIVMCLSCHRAHASPYYKMMRWDYKSSTLSEALSGCNVCHTSKS
jgi:hypothetical protein